MPLRLPARFTDADAARKYLETLIWEGNPVCAHCGALGQATTLKGKSTRPGVYWCNACRKPFSVTVGTVYEGSKIPLNTWLYANHRLCNAERPIPGLELARMLGVSYKTAWFMARHIREAMAQIPGPSAGNSEDAASGSQN
jgi:transposase-like protein